MKPMLLPQPFYLALASVRAFLCAGDPVWGQSFDWQTATPESQGLSKEKLDGKLSYDAWVDGVQAGRNYVSDGKSHLMDFKVNSLLAGTQNSEVQLSKPETVRVTAKVAPRLDELPNEELRKTRYDVKPYWDVERARIGDTREVPVELIVNGESVAGKNVFADGTMRELTFDIPIARSSRVALRVLPSSHTNPVFVTVGDQPIRASRRSAEWFLKAVDQCWNQKTPMIAAREREDAARAYEHARQTYRRVLAESEID